MTQPTATRSRTTDRLRSVSQRTFAALAVPNYRRFFWGQGISRVGTWMQSVAQSWLVLVLTGSGTQLGVVVALQTLPVLLAGPYGGVVADRVDKRRLMIGLQTMMGLLALALGMLTVTGAVRLWHVYLLAALLGFNNAFENPARQSFVLEMVGPRDLPNAITLNSVQVNVARAVGPAVAGVVIAAGGTGICFLLNAASFGAVVFSLVTMDVGTLQPSPPAERGPGQLRQGLSYVKGNPGLVVPLLMMAIVGMLAYEFSVVLPVVARQSFHGNAQTYGFMTAAMGLGAFIGGLVIATRRRTGLRALVIGAAAFGGVILAAAVAPTLPLELLALLGVGAGSVSFMSVGNSTLQLASSPTMRGRVMALWAVAFLGTTPLGGPIAGSVAEHAGGRWALVMGAMACFAAVAVGLSVVRRIGVSGEGGGWSSAR